jgi:hypothetical protein
LLKFTEIVFLGFLLVESLHWLKSYVKLGEDCSRFFVRDVLEDATVDLVEDVNQVGQCATLAHILALADLDREGTTLSIYWK